MSIAERQLPLDNRAPLLGIRHADAGTPESSRKRVYNKAMARFSGVDYLLIDSLFSEQELLVRQTARQFVEDRVIPIVRDCYRDGRFPTELIPEIVQLGFLGANLESYGCAGLSNVEYGLIMQEIERGDSGLRSFVSVQGALVMYPILTYGSAEQKDRWLPKMQSGEAIGCFGLTEPGF